MKIIITAACSASTRGLVRSIRLSERYKNSTIIGTDTLRNYYGFYEGLCDHFYKVPACTELDYEPVIRRIFSSVRADLIIVMHELEVFFWSKFKDLKGIHLVKMPSCFTEICVSKKRLYQQLENTMYVPRFQLIDFTKIKSEQIADFEYPAWIRDVTEGSGGGKGSFLLATYEKFEAWKTLFEPAGEYMVSELLPGRNLACLLLLKDNELQKAGIYERQEYFLANVSPTGVTGQISKGRLINDSTIVDFSMQAIMHLLASTGEKLTGLITVDLKEDRNSELKITEVNVRPVSPVFAFAQAGFNLGEYLLDVSMNVSMNSKFTQADYPKNNVIFREIDGLPLWVNEHFDL